MTSADTTMRTARFWTRARRFPRLIGKAVNGERIPGGPYTPVQAIGGFCTAWLLWQTRIIWGPGYILAELAFILGIAWATVWLLGHIPLNSRNPFITVVGLLQLVFSPRHGHSHGKRVTFAAFGPSRPPMMPTPPAPVWSGPLPTRGPTCTHTGDPTTDDLRVATNRSGATPQVPHEVRPPSTPSVLPLEPTGLQRLLADAAKTEPSRNADLPNRAVETPAEKSEPT